MAARACESRSASARASARSASASARLCAPRAEDGGPKPRAAECCCAPRALTRSLRARAASPVAEQELQGLQGAIQQLQVSRNKLTNSKDALELLSKTPDGTPMLVPLTSSLYVPGETAPLDNVLVDVGTGYFIEKSIDHAQAFLQRKMALIENLQRQDLNAIEEAAGYVRLAKDFSLKQEEIATRVGKSRASVANSMRLLDLQEPIQRHVADGYLTVGHAKAILGVKDPKNQLAVADQILRQQSFL